MNQTLPSIRIVRLPLYISYVAAGFPSPADDHLEIELDLNEYLIDKPHSTFCVRVAGNSMEGVNIRQGDILVVDRSKSPVSGRIVVAVLDGEFTVKRLLINKEGTFLVPEHPAYEPIPICDGNEFQVWGVVIYSIHKH